MSIGIYRKYSTIKNLLLLILMVFMMIFFTSCSSDAKDDSASDTQNVNKNGVEVEKVDENSDTIEIKERVFIAQINDIYGNFEDYEDKKIIVEGMFSKFDTQDAKTVPVVYRKGPGCCGNDGWGGFFLKYDGKLPKENAWIRVKGRPVLEKNSENYYDLYLLVESIEEKKERGAEFVKQ